MDVDEPVRSGTIGQPLQTAPNVSLSTEEIQWGQYCHFAGFFGIVGALICWLIKKDTSKYVDEQGKTAVNFQLTNFIASMVCLVTIIGIPIAFAIHVYSVVLAIIAGMKVSNGEIYKYPFSFNLIK